MHDQLGSAHVVDVELCPAGSRLVEVQAQVQLRVELLALSETTTTMMMMMTSAKVTEARKTI